ncbi:hypothetical protein ANN_12307 [Periplaneta americana]|uniref:Ionotropic glutamate receptor C-terminal domain-containing protein n=1 Tax=Periplaneta americana TaxID=6978 RepID=A0ABQ8TIF2_PERAM|nr:hypothetical protein ANN_12307 [Periplaneta americana]
MYNTIDSRVKVTDAARLSTASWLLFAARDVTLETFFSGINIPFDCEFLVAQEESEQMMELSEVYRINAEDVLHTYAFGNWTSRRGLRWRKMNIYERRNNLQGYVMKAAYKYGGEVLVSELEGSNVDRSNGVKFFFNHLWLILEKLLNFRQRLGALLKNGSWNGMMGMLTREEVDVAVDAFLMTTSRLRVISFMVPLLPAKSRPFIRRPDTAEHEWSDILRPFNTDLWLAVALTLTLLASFLSATYYAGRRYCRFQQPISFGFFESFFYIFGSFCQQGHSVTPVSGSCRIVYATSYLIGVVLQAAYSAALISYLTSQRIVLPFTTFQSLLELGTYRLAVLDRSAQLNYFDVTHVQP